MEDYIVDRKQEKEFQKLLNQWKHNYIIELLHVRNDFDYETGENSVFYVIKRTLKNKE